MKRFQFELDPLLKKHAWEADVLRTEKATASRAVSAQQDVLRSIEEQISEYRIALIGSSVEEAEISIAQRQMTAIYIRHQQQLENEVRTSLDKAIAVEQQISNHLLLASQQLKTLEKLKDRAMRQHAYRLLRAELIEADDNWLTQHNRT